MNKKKKNEYAKGEQVYVSDDGDEWLTGLVTKGGSNPEIKPVGWEKAYSGWQTILREKPKTEEIPEYVIGEEVSVRDKGKQWRNGVVTKGGVDPYIRVEGWEESYNDWHEIRRIAEVAKFGVNERVAQLDEEIGILEEKVKVLPKQIKQAVFKADYGKAGTLQPQLDQAKIDLEKLLKERRILVRKLRKTVTSVPEPEVKKSQPEKKDLEEPEEPEDPSHNKDGSLAMGCQVTVEVDDDVAQMATIQGPLNPEGCYSLTLNKLADVNNVRWVHKDRITALVTYKTLLHSFIQDSFVPWWVSQTDRKALAAILYPDLEVLPTAVIGLIIDYCKSIPKWKSLKIDEEEDTLARIKDRDAEAVGYILSFNTALTTLHFAEGRIPENGTVSLAEGLKINPNITSLDMRQIQTIGKFGRKALFQALKNSKTIKTFSGITLTWLKNPDLDVESDSDSEGSEDETEQEKAKKANEAKTINLSRLGLGNVEAIIIGEFLKINTVLTDINLFGNNFQFDGTKYLAESLLTNTTVKRVTLNISLALDRFRDVMSQKVDLSSQGYNDWDGIIIASYLQVNATLKEMIVENNQIGDYGADVFARNLIKNSTLEELSLEKNEIGVDGGTVLANALKKNKNLKKLFLSQNKIKDFGFKAMIRGLTENIGLTELFLCSNMIGNEGCRPMVEDFKKNSTLTVLWLDGNEIGNEGAEFIGKGLDGNSTLTDLSLRKNHIRNTGAIAIADGLKSNTTLKKLNLSLNKIGKTGQKRIKICHYNTGLELGDSFELQR